MAITSLHTFGWQKETELRERLEGFLGDRLQKTLERYDALDFKGAHFDVELKCRRPQRKGQTVTSQSYKTWVVPSTKIRALSALPVGRRGVVFYWFEGDRSLWYIFTDQIDWETIDQGVPIWHEQEHYFVPATLWRRVGEGCSVTEDVARA